MFLVKQKYICFEKKKCFDGKPKMTKKFEFEKLKIPNPDIWPYWEIFNFSNSILFVTFGFPLKKYFFFNILLFHQKCFGANSITREEDIFSKINLVTLGTKGIL